MLGVDERQYDCDTQLSEAGFKRIWPQELGQAPSSAAAATVSLAAAGLYSF